MRIEYNSVIGSAITITLILAAFAPLTAPQAHAVAPTVTACNLQVGSNPLSLASDGPYLYYASNSNGNVFKVNPSDCSSTTLSGISGTHNWMATYYYKDPLLNPTLYMVDSAGSGGLYAYDLTASTLTLVSFDNTANNIKSSLGQMLVAGQCSVGHFNFTTGTCNTVAQNFWYTIHQDGANARFDKVEYLKDVYSGNPDQYHNFPYTCASNAELCNTGGVYPGLATDSAGNVYITDQVNGCIIKYIATANSMAKYCGFNNPAGIVIDSSTNSAYIAQNTLGGGIVQWNINTHAITQTYATPSSTPFGITINSGTVIWTSNGSDHNVCTLAGTCVNTAETNYYVLPLPTAGKVAVGYVGSEGILITSGLIDPPATSSSTTSTTTFVTSSTTVSGTATSTVTYTTSSIVTTAAPSLTSNAEPTPGNPQQLIPTIVVDSTEYTTTNGILTITGYQYFPIGAGSDFITAQRGVPFCTFEYGVVSYLAGCLFKVPQFYADTAASNFNGMWYSVEAIKRFDQSYWTKTGMVNATHLWDGDPSRNPSLYQIAPAAHGLLTSDVRYGTRCSASGNWLDAKIFASPFDCRGLGTLIKYEAFTLQITLPPPVSTQSCFFTNGRGTASVYIPNLTEKVCSGTSLPFLIRLSAIGTNSGNEISFDNIIVHDNRINYYTITPVTQDEFVNSR